MPNPIRNDKRWRPDSNKIHTANTHKVYGDWRLHENDVNRYLNLESLKNMITHDKLQTITLNQVAFRQDPDVNKRGTNCSCCGGNRYTGCDTRIAPLLCEGRRNPSSKTYTIIDGNHRMQKMLDTGVTEAKFFVLKYEDIKQYYLPYF